MLLIFCCVAGTDTGALSLRASNNIFEDKFTNDALTGWKAADVGIVSDGMYNIKGDGINLVSSPISEARYSVQTKVTLKQISSKELSSAAVVIGSDTTGTECYEFGIGAIKSSTYAYLYRQSQNTVNSETIYQITSDVPGTENGKVKTGTEYTLTAVVADGMLHCYINGEKFTETNVTTTNNYAGVRSNNANATYDDFVIQKTEQKQIASLTLLNTPSEVTVNGGGLSFGIQVNYNGLYGREIIDSSAEGVSITGFDGKTGNKKLTVSYGGKSESFTTNIVEEAEGKTLFSDNFNKGLDQEKWTLTELTTQNGYGFNYQFDASSGSVIANFPSNIGNYKRIITAKADLDNSLIDKVQNYEVAVTTAIISNTTVAGGRAADAALDVAASSGAIYSYRVRADGTAILYYGTTEVAKGRLPDFKLGAQFRMKAKTHDTLMLCYVGNDCILTYQSESLSVQNRKVDVGFRAVNGTVKFDNFAVTEIPERSVWAATGISLNDLKTDEENIDTVEANYLDYGRYLVKLHYANGAFMPVAFHSSMISGYTSGSKNQQTVILKYGPLSKKITYKYTACLFYDNFVSRPSAEWTDLYTAPDHITLKCNNGLQITCTSDTTNRQVAQYVDLFEEYPNVSVSADVTMKHTANAQIRRIGVRARYQKSAYYEWVLSYESSRREFSLVLFRYNKGVLTELVKYSEGAIQNMSELESIDMGKAYNLTLECVDNQLFLYFNGKLFDVYVDESPDAVLSGAGAGYRAINTSGTIANFQVYEASNRAIKSLELAGTDGNLDIYQGFTISPYDHSLKITFTDGTVVNKAMTADMIGAFDNITPGTKTVEISCYGKKFQILVHVVERTAYLKEFADLVRSSGEAEQISIKDKEAVDKLEEIYRSLSGYEISTIDEKIIEKYNAVVEALYKLENQELAEYDTVYVNDFSGDLIESEWSTYEPSAMGTWTTVNGVLVNELERYEWNNKISYLEYLNFYGQVNSVEADVMLTNEYGCHASILSCISDIGYYHARITNEYEGNDGKKAFMVQLYKFSGSHRKLGEAYLELQGIDMDVNEWHNLRLTNMDGLLNVYVDDIKVLTYDDSASSSCMKTGTFGFRSLYGDMRYDSLRVMGVDLSGEEYVPQIEPTYYEDDFEDETAGEDPSHWIEETSSDHWKVYQKNGNLVYGTTSRELSYSWLHTFESDPVVSMDFMVENVSGTGRIEFLTRYTQAVYSYAGIGYDFAQSKWYIYTARGEDFEPRILYAEDTYDLKAGEWYSIKIEENGISIKVYVNEQLVLEETNAYMTGYGRIGVLSENANLYIDNVSYTMPHGGNVDDGVMEYRFDYDTFGYVSHMETESLGGSTLIGVSSNRRFVSKDNGMTWALASDAYTDVKGAGLGYPSILELSEGVHIMVYADTFAVYKSTDYMKTWEKIGNIIPDIGDNLSETGAWENLIHVNSLTKVTLDDGTVRIFLPVGMRRFGDNGRYSGHYTRVFYSDDFGATWAESSNDTRDITPNYTEDISEFFSWVEAKIIKCSDGSLRMYQSRQYDCIVYSESHDGGVTWERVNSVPYLQNGQTSFGVAEDPDHPGTYYMVCLNTKSSSYNSAYPRNRLSLVKSTDGKQWEFITDIERFSSISSYKNSEMYQIIDPSISIINGYMYITMGRSYCGQEGTHGYQSVLMIRQEMDKLAKPAEWNDATLADSTRAKTLEIEEKPQTIFGLNDLFVISGTLKVTAFNGTVTYKDLKELALAEREPNMYAKGTYTVSLMNLYAQYVSYDIEVTDNYNITWNIVGKGEVTPYYAKIAKGLERTFTAVPEEGWHVGEVLINGEKVKVVDNQFSVTGSEDIVIDVVFTDKDSNGIIWLVVIILGIIILITGGIIAIYIFQKRRKKQKEGGDQT